MQQQQQENKKISNICFVLDISGSMDSNCMNDKESPLVITRLETMIYSFKVFLLCMANLNKTNTSINLSIVLFDDKTETVLDNVVLDKDKNLQNILAILDTVVTKGSTNMYNGLKVGLLLLKKGCEYYNNIEKQIASNHLVLLTDGESDSPYQGVNDLQTLKTLQNNYPMNIHTIGFSCYSNMRVLYEIQREFETEKTCGIVAYIHDGTTGFEIFKGIAANMINSFEKNKIMLGTQYNNNQPIVKEYNKLITAIDSKSNRYNNAFLELHNEFETIVQNIDVMGEPYSLDCEQLKEGLLQNQDAFCTWGEKYVRDLSNKYLLGINVNPKAKGPAKQFTTSRIQTLLDEMKQFEKQLGAPKQSINTNWKPVIKTLNMTPEEIEAKKQELLKKAAAMQSCGARIDVSEIGCGGCFDINATIKVLDEESNLFIDVSVKLLRKGMKVLSTDNKIATVDTVFVTHNAKHLPQVVLQCTKTLNTLLITKYHPIFENGKWIHPVNSSKIIHTSNINVNCEIVVTVMFDKKSVEQGCYSVFANGFEVITVGHEIKNDDIASHCFYGNYFALTLYKNYLDFCENDVNENKDELFKYSTKTNIVEFIQAM